MYHCQVWGPVLFDHRVLADRSYEVYDGVIVSLTTSMELMVLIDNKGSHSMSGQQWLAQLF